MWAHLNVCQVSWKMEAGKVVDQEGKLTSWEKWESLGQMLFLIVLMVEQNLIYAFAFLSLSLRLSP